MKTEKTKWPDWQNSNVALFITGLCLGVGAFCLLCLFCDSPRIVFIITALMGGAGCIALLWYLIDQRDRHQKIDKILNPKDQNEK